MKHTCFCSLQLFPLNYCFCALGQDFGREHSDGKHPQKELLRESNREMNFRFSTLFFFLFLKHSHWALVREGQCYYCKHSPKSISKTFMSLWLWLLSSSVYGQMCMFGHELDFIANSLTPSSSVSLLSLLLSLASHFVCGALHLFSSLTVI